MATQFDPDPKALNQELNGQGYDFLNGKHQNNSTNYSNSQPYLNSVSPESVANAIEFQQMSVPASQQTSQKFRVSGWKKLRLTQKATALAIARSQGSVVNPLTKDLSIFKIFKGNFLR